MMRQYIFAFEHEVANGRAADQNIASDGFENPFRAGLIVRNLQADINVARRRFVNFPQLCAARPAIFIEVRIIDLAFAT